ncbi:hypothetical protein N566_13450 [Streptomycetaceae bacterium MP113-05]|nr:hypothetical protein N566_13450 [Streptomycetaceae bacterium MP113-05]
MSDQRIGKMLQAMVGNEVVAVSPPLASVKKGAALAHVAEQFGFVYADAKLHGYRNSQLTVFLVRDPRPEAAQRAAATTGQFPQAGQGGPVPGLRQGRLTPLPEAKDAVELLTARIIFDTTGKKAEKQIWLGMVGVVVGATIAGLVRGDGSAGALYAYLSLAALICLVLGGGILFTRKRNTKAAARLRTAGLQEVRDENGRVRYLPPGQHLPGQGNPFGGQPGPYGQQAPYGRQGNPGQYPQHPQHNLPNSPYPAYQQPPGNPYPQGQPQVPGQHQHQPQQPQDPRRQYVQQQAPQVPPQYPQ